MSKHTAGEIAKLCGVSVRTVQYYDSRNILVPSELSEGGRRLYSEDDLKRMRIICFLREAGLPINSIGELFAEEHPEKIISILLDQQEQALRDEIAEGQKKLGIIENIKHELKEVENLSVNDSIIAIVSTMSKPSCASCLCWHRRRDLFVLFVLLGVAWRHRRLPYGGTENSLLCYLT